MAVSQCSYMAAKFWTCVNACRRRVVVQCSLLTGGRHSRYRSDGSRRICNPDSVCSLRIQGPDINDW
jgi:hypothetical protein